MCVCDALNRRKSLLRQRKGGGKREDRRASRSALPVGKGLIEPFGKGLALGFRRGVCAGVREEQGLGASSWGGGGGGTHGCVARDSPHLQRDGGWLAAWVVEAGSSPEGWQEGCVSGREREGRGGEPRLPAWTRAGRVCQAIPAATQPPKRSRRKSYGQAAGAPVPLGA